MSDIRKLLREVIQDIDTRRRLAKADEAIEKAKKKIQITEEECAG